jgi:hypothetical protein
VQKYYGDLEKLKVKKGDLCLLRYDPITSTPRGVLVLELLDGEKAIILYITAVLPLERQYDRVDIKELKLVSETTLDEITLLIEKQIALSTRLNSEKLAIQVQYNLLI